MYRWEWLIIELLVVVVAVYELISITRATRRDRREAAARKLAATGENDPPA